MNTAVNGAPKRGHEIAVALMEKKVIMDQVEKLGKALDDDEIYCRPIDGKLKCISTRIIGNRAMTGILEGNSKNDFCFGVIKRLKEGAIEEIYKHKSLTKSQDKIDIEEKNFEAWLIRHALRNKLRMHEDLTSLLFVNSQWRFEPFAEEERRKFGKDTRQYLDILAFDPTPDSEKFVVIELKKKDANDWQNAEQQAKVYCEKLNAGDFSDFFLSLLKNMVTWYIDSEEQQELLQRIERLQNNKKELTFTPMAIRPSSAITSHEDTFRIEKI